MSVQILTKEQIEEAERQHDEWWASLSWWQKYSIHRFLGDWDRHSKDVETSQDTYDDKEQSKAELLELAFRLRKVAQTEAVTVGTLHPIEPKPEEKDADG